MKLHCPNGSWLSALLCVSLPLTGRSQQPPAATTASYRAPVLVLALPSSGGSVPADKPVVVFRYSQGEQLDPIDVRSFTIAVDSNDRTALFHVSVDEAWGPLGDTERPVTAGPHSVTARVCSLRGACALASAVITVTPAPPVPSTETGPKKPNSTRQRLLDALLSAARKLINP